jgi:hypothetical protein
MVWRAEWGTDELCGEREKQMEKKAGRYLLGATFRRSPNWLLSLFLSLLVLVFYYFYFSSDFLFFFFLCPVERDKEIKLSAPPMGSL